MTTATSALPSVETFAYSPGSTVEVVTSHPCGGDVVVEAAGPYGNFWVRRECMAVRKQGGGYEVAFGGCYGWYHALNIRNVVRAA